MQDHSRVCATIGAASMQSTRRIGKKSQGRRKEREKIDIIVYILLDEGGLSVGRVVSYSSVFVLFCVRVWFC